MTVDPITKHYGRSIQPNYQEPASEIDNSADDTKVSWMREAYWIWPAVILTALVGTAAVVIYPNPSSLLGGLIILPSWMVGTVGILSAPLLAKTLNMMLRGEQHPLRALYHWIDWPNVARILFGMAIAGANMVAFLCLKPGLNVIIPFWADPLLASIDNFIFAGHDPWALLEWANNDLAGFFYHPVWFFLMICALIFAFAAPPSAKRTAILVSYFLSWSVIGPLIHSLFPAGGPIFFEALGYGNRFAAIDGGRETALTAEFLWRNYSDGRFVAASGISAMPSLHITLAVWTVISMSTFRPSWKAPTVIASAYIFVLSISLGWHYAIDGIVGGAAAYMTYRLLLRAFTSLNDRDTHMKRQEQVA